MKSKPVHVALAGNVRIKVLRNGNAGFCIAWRPHAGAKRTRETFPAHKRQAAIDRANEIAAAIANGQADALTLTGTDRDAWRLIVQSLAPFGIPPVAAIQEFIAAKKLIGPDHTLLQAAEAFAAQQRQRNLVCPPTTKIVAELLSSLTNRRHRRIEKKTSTTLRARIDRFAKSFPDLTKPTEHDLLQYLDNLTVPPKSKTSTAEPQPVSAKTRDHHRDTIRQIFRYAQRRQWLPAGPTAADNLERVHRPGAVASYTPAELRAMLAGCKPEWIPFLALAAFAGLRTSEIYRLHWEHFRWTHATPGGTPAPYIAIPMHVAAKTFRPRPVPITDNLTLWLQPYRRDFGPIFDHTTLDVFEDALQNHVVRHLEATIPGFAWKYNALRHSFVSYRLALTQNPGQVKIEAGHTESMQSRHYNDPKTPAEAAAYFAILPPWPANTITPIATATGAVDNP
jgi:integrase